MYVYVASPLNIALDVKCRNERSMSQNFLTVNVALATVNIAQKVMTLMSKLVL
jgi:hypothetical protein